MEGSARLLAWYDPESPNSEFPSPGQFFVQLFSGGKALTEPILLEDEAMTKLEGPHLDTLPEEEPFEVVVGPLTIRGWDLEFSVELGGKVAKGSIRDLRQGIVGTFM